MARGKVTARRPVAPDSKYNSVVVTRFIGRMMLSGKKSITTKIMYDSFDKIKEKTGEEPLAVFSKALDNV